MGKLMVKIHMCYFIFLLFFSHSSPVVALTRDPLFGENGLVKTRVGHYVDKAQAVVVQPDGRVLVAGSSSNNSNLDFALVRYKPDGSLDNSFHFNGQVVTVVGGDDDVALGVALQDDDKILACGYTFNGKDRDLALLRFTTNGSLDPDFGESGIVVLPVGSGNDVAAAVAIQPDGTILVAGTVEEDEDKAGALVRFLSNGSLDLSFGHAGVIRVDVGDNAEIAAMAIQEDGSIVLAGYYEKEAQRRVLLTRFLADGSSDDGFGVDGVAETPNISMDTIGNSLWVQEDGAILVAGSVGLGKNKDVALFRFTRDGKLDRGFGGGMLRYDMHGEDDVGYGVSANATSLFIAGYTTVNDRRDFVLLQCPLTQNIQPKLSVVTSGLSQFDGVAHALALQSDDKIIAVGFSEDVGTSSFVLAQYAGKELDVTKEASAKTGTSYITTTAVTEITRVSCLTGGEITAGSGMTFTSRGVVYSLAPYPILTSGGTDGATDSSDNTDDTDDGGTDGNGNDTDTTGPTRSNPVPAPGTVLPVGTTSTTISLTTSEAALCRYFPGTGTAYSAMHPFENTGGTTHSTSVTGLHDGVAYSYSVKCEGQSGNINGLDYSIYFSVAQTAANAVAETGKVIGEGVQIGQKQIQISSAKDASGSVTTFTTDVSVKGSTSDGAGIGRYSSIISQLTPGTRYYVRAYGVTSKNIIYYGNQLSFETKDACFIATAAYGSLLDPHVQTLRLFRDKYLMIHDSGRMLVRLYYHYSPSIAEFIADRPVLRLVARIFLLPLIVCSHMALHIGVTGMGLALLAVLGTVAAGFRVIHQKI